MPKKATSVANQDRFKESEEQEDLRKFYTVVAREDMHQNGVPGTVKVFWYLPRRNSILYNDQTPLLVLQRHPQDPLAFGCNEDTIDWNWEETHLIPEEFRKLFRGKPKLPWQLYKLVNKRCVGLAEFDCRVTVLPGQLMSLKNGDSKDEFADNPRPCFVFSNVLAGSPDALLRIELGNELAAAVRADDEHPLLKALEATGAGKFWWEEADGRQFLNALLMRFEQDFGHPSAFMQELDRIEDQEVRDEDFWVAHFRAENDEDDYAPFERWYDGWDEDDDDWDE